MKFLKKDSALVLSVLPMLCLLYFTFCTSTSKRIEVPGATIFVDYSEFRRPLPKVFNCRGYTNNMSQDIFNMPFSNSDTEFLAMHKELLKEVGDTQGLQIVPIINTSTVKVPTYIGGEEGTIEISEQLYQNIGYGTPILYVVVRPGINPSDPCDGNIHFPIRYGRNYPSKVKLGVSVESSYIYAVEKDVKIPNESAKAYFDEYSKNRIYQGRILYLPECASKDSSKCIFEERFLYDEDRNDKWDGKTDWRKIDFYLKGDLDWQIIYFAEKQFVNNYDNDYRLTLTLATDFKTDAEKRHLKFNIVSAARYEIRKIIDKRKFLYSRFLR